MGRMESRSHSLKVLINLSTKPARRSSRNLRSHLQESCISKSFGNASISREGSYCRLNELLPFFLIDLWLRQKLGIDDNDDDSENDEMDVDDSNDWLGPSSP